MTEYWKSNPMHWCDVCRVWLQDNPTAKANHERGQRHQDNLAKKLRDMRKKGDAVKAEAKSVKSSLKKIEAAAMLQYDSDVKAMAAVPKYATTRACDAGKWVLDPASGYYYNDLVRYYYDKASQWYYGGDPPDWTQTPSIPQASMFGANPPRQEKNARSAQVNGVEYTRRSVKRVVPHHPLAGIGGHKMPTEGKVGGLKRLGEELKNLSKDEGKLKKKLKSSRGKNISKEEQEAQKKRDAARARVQQRTMETFGLG